MFFLAPFIPLITAAFSSAGASAAGLTVRAVSSVAAADSGIAATTATVDAAAPNIVAKAVIQPLLPV